MTDRLCTTTPEIEKARALWEKAVFLMERTDGYHRKVLYQYRHLYIEVAWHTHFNTVASAVIFSGTDRLSPYLDAITITEIFS